MEIKKLGRFEIIREIGSGGMGLVYKGRDPRINRLLALKVVRPALGSKSSADKIASQRFYVEAQAAGQLSHPNIVTIYDVGEERTVDGALVYIAMEFIDGKGLDWHIQNKTYKTVPEIINVIRQIAAGISYAHSHNVIHRDIKPANILITKQNVPKITDFGLARLSDSSLTVSGTILGTPNYMAPEQVQGRPVDARSDFFSLTVLLYEMLTGSKPFASDSITSVIYKVVNEDPALPTGLNPALPKQFDSIIMRGLAKNPERRFQTGEEFIKALSSAVSGGSPGVHIVGDVTVNHPDDGSTAEGRSIHHAAASAGKRSGNKATIAILALSAILVIGWGGKLMFSGGPEGQTAETTTQVAKLDDTKAGQVAEDKTVVAEPAEDKPDQINDDTVEPTPDESKGSAEKPEAKPADEKKVASVEPAEKEPVIEKKPDKKSKPKAKKKKADKPKPAPEIVKAKPEPPKPEKKIVSNKPGFITLTSDPEGADAFVDGLFIGATPINNMKIMQGTHDLKLSRSGYDTKTETIVLEESGTFEVALEKSASKDKEGEEEPAVVAETTTGIQLEVLTPPDSIIVLDGRHYKEAKLTVDTLSVGSHMIYVQMKDRKPYNERFTLKEGQKKIIDLIKEQE